MKKLFTALAICVSTAAFAQADTSDVPEAPSAQQREPRAPLFEATDLRSQQPGSSTEQAAETKQLRDEQGIGGSGKDTQGLRTEDQGTFKTAEAFDVRGTLKKASDDELTLTRVGLPEVELDVRDQTVVMLDGKSVKADKLPEGAQVRAKFQLVGDEIVAVRVDAKSSGAKKDSGTGGAGSAGTELEQDAKEAGQDVKDAAKDVENKVHREVNE